MKEFNTLTVFTLPTCPKCKVVKMKLESKGLTYTECQDMDAMQSLGLMGTPALLIPNPKDKENPKILKTMIEINNWIESIK